MGEPASIGRGRICAGGSAPLVSNIKKAAAFRVKYRVQLSGSDDRVFIHPRFVVPHPCNRGGVGVNGDRCDELLGVVFKHWNDDEANHGAVCIQEKPGQTRFYKYNLAKTQGDAKLAKMTDDLLAYGSVGSSHINQVLRNVNGSALAESAPDAVRDNKTLCVNLVGAHDPAMKVACGRGLRWEVLSYKLEEEEPDGVSVIVAALNEVSLAQMADHEMQHIRTLAEFCKTEANTAGQVCLDAIRTRLRASGGAALADSLGMLSLFQFVVEQGGAAANGFVEPLVEFHEKFVNPKVRRLREYHFRLVCGLPHPLPRLALLAAAYGQKKEKIRDGWIDYFGPLQITEIMKEPNRASLELANDILVCFHGTYASKGAYAEMDNGDRVVLLGRLDMDVGRCLLVRDGFSLDAKSLNAVAFKHDTNIRALVGSDPAVIAKLPPPWPNPNPTDAAHDGKASCAGGLDKAILPQVIEYDGNGKAQNKQSEVSREAAVKDVDMTGETTSAEVQSEIDKSSLFWALHKVHSMFAVQSKDTFRVQQEGTKCSFKVHAKTALAVGSFFMAPLVPSMQSIGCDSSHPHRVQTELSGPKGKFCISPCIRPPTDKLSPCIRPVELWMVPFWLVRRSGNRDECNVEMTKVSLDLVLLAAASAKPFKLEADRMMGDARFMIPVLSNHVAIKEKDEIVLFWTKLDANKDKNKRVRTWLDDAAQSSKKK